jgi:transcriptional regulator with XRE-family HTH domain
MMFIRTITSSIHYDARDVLFTRMNSGQFVREARRRAGLSQRVLAARAGVSQPLVARIESGDVDPSFGRCLQLVRACGFDLDIHLTTLDEDAWTLVERGDAASPDERLDRMLAGIDLLRAGQEGRDD